MNKELPKVYAPQEIEKEIYDRWEKSGFLNPDSIDSKDTYCNILPPPNANGELHLGHACGYTVMDIFGRWARMNGKKTLLFPGKDHAGIQTQVVFEKILESQGTSRQEIGRKKFYQQTYDFCMDRANYMRAQEKRIGIAADWSRERFTLDPQVLNNALETFVKMEKEGLIYKGKRIINWCPRCASALSDVEVLHKETSGKLFYIKYPIENETDMFVTVATTRPETMLGDVAIAVNPEDERYTALVGKNVILPLQNRLIPIIADSRIDKSFGTGAVKITPAHDPLDWEIGKDQNLGQIQVIDEQATITQLGGNYAGMEVAAAREKILADLADLSLIEKEDEITHSVSICERCKTTIEPLISSQWFINVDAPHFSLKKNAIEAITDGRINIFPENFKKILIDWFTNMRDWCISRQIWWGPQFPVWNYAIPSFAELEKLKEGKNQKQVGEEGSSVHIKNEDEYRFIIESEEDFKWIEENVQFESEFSYMDFFDMENRFRITDQDFTVSPKETSVTGVIVKHGKSGTFEGKKVCFEEKKTAGVCRYEIEFKGIVPKYFKHHQPIVSTDILYLQKSENETSSIFIGAKGPYFKEGWIQDENTFDTWFSSGQWAYTTLQSNKDEFEMFYPSEMMVMGRDLLFFWASRMIMMSLYRTNEVPFKNLYFTGLVRDKDGQKMSKSKGNGIDPLLMIDKFGADALRMSLIMDSAPGQDSRLYEEKIETFRNFANKLWNISRFVMSQDGFISPDSLDRSDLLYPADGWIIYRLHETVEEIDRLFASKQIAVAADVLKTFTWNDFADWYVEISKVEKNQKVLGYVLDRILRLWHPFMPFITEHIWTLIGKEKLLLISEWPKVEVAGVKDMKKDVHIEGGRIFMENYLKEIIIAIRNIRTENKIDATKKINIAIDKKTDGAHKLLAIPSQEEIIRKLKTGVDQIEFGDKENDPTYIKRTISDLAIYVSLAQAIDVEKEKQKLQSEIDSLEKNIESIEGKLSDEDFKSKAPENVVALQQSLLSERKVKLEELKKHLKSLK